MDEWIKPSLLNMARFEGGGRLFREQPGEFEFGQPLKGVHAGLHPDDSNATMAYAWPEANPDARDEVKSAFQKAVEERCKEEKDPRPSIADLVTGLKAFSLS